MRIHRSSLPVVAGLAASAWGSLAHAQYSQLYNFQSTDGVNPTAPTLLAQSADGKLYGTLQTGGTSGKGTVFSIGPNGGFSLLLTFGTASQGYPHSGLTLGLDGNLYGAEAGVGTSHGDVFSFSPSTGAYGSIYSFSNGGDGAWPWAPPLQAPDLNLYGVTYNGAVPGTIYRIAQGGAVTILYPGQGQTSSAMISPLTWGIDGNLYGTQPSTGTANQGAIFRISAPGSASPQYSVIFSFSSTQNTGTGPVGGVIFGSDGNLYGTTANGGSYGQGVVYQFNPNTGAYKVLRSFQSTEGSNSSSSLVQGTDGFLYGVQPAGGAAPPAGLYTVGFGTLYRIAPDGTGFQVLHNFYDPDGSNPQSTPTLHTNGVLYGVSQRGGSLRPGYGTVYRYATGMTPFASLVGGSRVLAGGQQVALLGQGFNSATGVMFGNVKASFAKALSDTYMIATVPPVAVLPPTVIPVNPIQGHITVLEPTGNLVTPQIFTTWHPCGTVLCQVPTIQVPPRIVNPFH